MTPCAKSQAGVCVMSGTTNLLMGIVVKLLPDSLYSANYSFEVNHNFTQQALCNN